MKEMYDFIIDGGGPSGCVVASRLTRLQARPTVLLLKPGGTNEDVDHMSGAERFEVAFKPGSPLNWGYKTVPHFNREIDYSRGKGLGGSTAINFCRWVIGADADYNEWARLVNDEAFEWSHVRKCLRRIETLHIETPAGFQHHNKPHAEAHHGLAGLINVGYGTHWLRSTGDVFKAAEQSGLCLNSDLNSGNPIGMGIGTTCIHNGERITAASAYLSNKPANLTIWTNQHVHKVLCNGKVATSVEAVDGLEFRARQEVIISGGAVNSPQLLMVSGVGPAAHLASHGIGTVQDLPQVGRNLQDHCFSSAGIVLKKTCDSSEEKQSPSPMGWLKIDAVERSTELKDLSGTTRTYLGKPAVSH